jgi:hypothetical protein
MLFNGLGYELAALSSGDKLAQLFRRLGWKHDGHTNGLP